jgi:hypothetical protein
LKAASFAIRQARRAVSIACLLDSGFSLGFRFTGLSLHANMDACEGYTID